MSQDNNPDDPADVLVADKAEEEISGYVEDYGTEQEEPTGAQKETDDDVPQDADDQTDDASEDGDESESEESQSESESEKDRLAKLQHAIKVQAYENRELKRKFKEIEEQKGKTEGKQAPLEEESSGAPKVPRPEDPGIEYDDEKFASALEEYHKKAAAYYRREEEQKEQRIKAEKSHQKKVDAFVESSQTLQEKDPVYAELVKASSSIRFSDTVTEALLNSENAGALHRALISDPDRLEGIQAMSPYSAMREIVKIESGLSAKAPEPAPRKKVSSAPDPVKLSRGVSSPSTGTPSGYKEDY